MISVITVIIIITISFLVTKIGTISLMHTGLSRQSSKFQALSAFTGVGYATKEAENIVNHPLRRKIIMLLMLLGNAGIVSVIATLLLTVLDNSNPHDLSLTARIALLTAGITGLIILFNSKIVNRALSKVIHFLLKHYTKLNVRDYSGLLHLAGEYEISEVFVEENDWLADRRLAEIALPKEGLFVLGINRKSGTYLGVPGGEASICPGDTLILYGRAPAIKRINERKKDPLGNFERKMSEKENRTVQKKEKQQDLENSEKKAKEKA